MGGRYKWMVSSRVHISKGSTWERMWYLNITRGKGHSRHWPGILSLRTTNLWLCWGALVPPFLRNFFSGALYLGWCPKIDVARITSVSTQRGFPKDSFIQHIPYPHPREKHGSLSCIFSPVKSSFNFRIPANNKSIMMPAVAAKSLEASIQNKATVQFNRFLDNLITVHVMSILGNRQHFHIVELYS